MLRLYNTLSRKIEEFKPINPDLVTVYHCGPTVYWTQHIGNLRGMAMGDLLVRTLKYSGYKVKYVRNYTDVGHLTSDSDTGEDKMEKGAKREGITPEQVAQKYIDIFEADTKSLNLTEPQIKPRPSELISDIIRMVQALIDKGFAYTTDLAVYFDVSKFPNYTQLSGHKIEMNINGAGKSETEDKNKKNYPDFALWIFKAGSHSSALQSWISPFKSKLVSEGRGFPGWHIECSVMSKKYLGNTIDIHFGGVEHIPIHHTNEIAQSESANGVKFVNYWLHNEHLLVNDEKMAKSQGTGMSVSEIIEKGFDPMSLRYFYLQAQYRSRQNFTWDALAASKTALNELKSRIVSIKKQSDLKTRIQLSDEKLAEIDNYKNKFTKSIENDLNIPQALATLWEVVKSNIPSNDKYDLILDFDQVLGLNLAQINIPVNDTINLPEEVRLLIKNRDMYRKNKEFKKSDEIRHKLESLGYMVEDTPEGTKLKNNNRN